MRKKVRTTLKNILVFMVISAWLLTGWPAIWIPGFGIFPPKPKEAYASTCGSGFGTAIGGGQCRGFLVSGVDTSPWTVPLDWGGAVSIQVIGGGKGGTSGTTGTGGVGGAGGAGGGYAAITSFTTTGGSTVSFQIGTGGGAGSNGGDTWFSSTGTVLAAGGGTGTAQVGTTKYVGGPAGTTSNKAGAGGGGAAGPIKTTTGDGKQGGGTSGTTTPSGGGGGGANGDSATVGIAGSSTFGAGGDGYNGTGHGSTNGAAGTALSGGGGAGGNGVTSGAPTPGGQGATGSNLDASHGSGGGGGGGGAQIGTGSSKGNGGAGGPGGAYGGGGGGGGGTNANGTSGGTGGTGGNGIIAITYTIDSTAPTPNPMTFSSSPNNDAVGQISMTASQASDNFVAQSAISYLFTNDNSSCTYPGNGGTTSSWQLNNRNYTDTGLDPNECYGYRVQTKDTAGNTTSGETVITTYSSAATPGQPTLDTPTTSSLTFHNAENGNPATNPTTLFNAKVILTSPTDSNWYGKWIDASGNPSGTIVWLADSSLDGKVLNGMQASTTYSVQVQAENQDGDLTSYGTTGSGTTSSANTAPYAPSLLYANEQATGAQSGELSPVVALGDANPVFSARYTDPDAGNQADYYEIIVYSDSCSTQVWDSGQTALTSCDTGNRCNDITYGGTTPLPFDGSNYHWEIRYWDTGGLAGPYSDCTDNFSILGPADQMRHGDYYFNNATKRVYTW